MIKSHSPYTNDTIKEFEPLQDHQVQSLVQDSYDTFRKLSETTIAQRKEWLVSAASILTKNKRQYASLITQEMGKLIGEAESEIEKCAWACNYYGENAESFTEDALIESDASKSYVAYRPIGPVLAVMPWNFPFWQVFRFAAPNLMLGNTALLKHASNVPQCALAIEEIFQKAGFPTGAFTTLLISSEQVSQIIADPYVQGVTLTGSGPAGKAVAETAGKHLKKVVLELGGSDPYIILEDADLDLAVEVCVKGRLLNAGQSCIGAKRFIVHEALYDQFLAKFTSALEDVNFGDPMEESTSLAPLSSFDARDSLHKQVEDAVAKGATLHLGGTMPEDQSGAFYPATILTDVDLDNPVAKEELFGPVAQVYKVSSEAEAIQLANATSFGLGASVFTKDVARGEQIAKYQLDAGCCFVNSLVSSDPRLPFGGVKQSGIGRELSRQGILEFANAKTVSIA